MLLYKHLSLPTALLLTTTLVHAQTFGNYSDISNVSSTACASKGGVHIIVARASDEPLGYGLIGYVKDQLLTALPGSNADYVDYPATLGDYEPSEILGVLGMKSLVDAYLAQSCSDAPLVLMGYSQGAQVVADYLSGQNDAAFAENSTLDEPPSTATLSQVVAAIMMGDPSLNVTYNPFHVGNSTKSGLFARHENSSHVFNTTGLSERIQSYCDALDPYCASGNFSDIGVHLGYVVEYGAAAEKYVVGKVKDYFANETGSSNATTSTTASATASATASSTLAVYTGAAVALKGMQSGGTLAVTLGLAAAFLCGL